MKQTNKKQEVYKVLNWRSLLSRYIPWAAKRLQKVYENESKKTANRVCDNIFVRLVFRPNKDAQLVEKKKKNN